jgi:NitT/TauT family transport system ATP-binding protein
MDQEWTGMTAHSSPQLAKLEAWDATKIFQVGNHAVVAVEDISMQVNTNEFVTIVGTSGCGKSTFLNLVAGLTPLTSGLISVDGKPVAGPGRDRGMVFQNYTLFP